MAKILPKILCQCVQLARSTIQPISVPLPYHRRSLSNYQITLTRCIFNQAQHFAENTQSVETDIVSKSNPRNGKDMREWLKKEGFQPIYKLRYPHMFAAISKLKWQQLYFTIGCFPLSLIGNILGYCTSEVPILVLCIGGVFSSTLWLTGIFVKNAVGLILISPDSKTVCLSYMDGKGRRQDDLVPADDLMPLSDTPRGIITHSWWTHLYRYSLTEEEYVRCKLFLQYCDVIDSERFKKVFGTADLQ